MKNQRHLMVLLIVGLVLFNLLFWKEGMGLNSLIFTLFSIPSVFFIYPTIRNNRNSIFFGASTLLLALFIVLNHSALSVIMFFLSYLIFLGFSFYNHQHLPQVAGLKGILQIVQGPFRSIGVMSEEISIQLPFKRFFYYLKIILIPLAIISLFLVLYSAANEIVASYTSNLFEFVIEFFENLSFSRLLFFAFSFLCVGALLTGPKDFEKVIKNIPILSKVIVRQKRHRGDFIAHQKGMMNLKKEYRIAQISLVGLNVLILFVNLIDISTIWIGNPASEQIHLKTFVHQGTYILIVSILLAMSLLVVLFRKNINFLPKNKSLKVMAYFWIAQNAIMVISVFLRNYTYIQWHGLAYKRIGVMVFLILTLYGLWTMYQKVRSKHSLRFLIRQNSFAVFTALLICSALNWDVLITKYNLENKFYGAIDIGHLIYNVSTKNYQLLKHHEASLHHISSFPSINQDQIEKGLARKKNLIITWHENRSWLSWNLPNWKNKQYLEIAK